MLKFARLLFRYSVRKFGLHSISHVLVRPLSAKPESTNHIWSAEYFILLRKPTLHDRLAVYLERMCAIPPLSKFGISARVRIIQSSTEIPSEFRRKNIFVYSTTDSHRFTDQVSLSEALKTKNPVLSVIRAQVEVPHG